MSEERAAGAVQRTRPDESNDAAVGRSPSPNVHCSRPGAGAKPRPLRVRIAPPLTGPRCGTSCESCGEARALIRWKVAAPGVENRRPSTDTRMSTEWLAEELLSVGDAHASSLGETNEAAVGPSGPKAQRMA
jgi:hypothetical protein